jgi:DNA-binding transcriptional MocR family regulator
MDELWTNARLLRSLGNWSDAGEGALFRVLAERLRTQIRQGRIPSGARLPSERSFAAAIGVSRSTVVAAFDELRSEGLITSKQGSGTRVTSTSTHRIARGESRLESFAQRASASTVLDLRSAAPPGLPMVAAETGRLTAEDVEAFIAGHGYSPEGLLVLRDEIAEYYTAVGLPTAREQVLVTSGAQQALRLITTAFVEPGATVVVEDPTFRGAIEVLRSSGARLVTVPSGPEGIDLAATAEALMRTRARMLFVQASGHNPTGSVLSAARRKALAAMCEEHDVLLVEDAAVMDAVIDGRPLAPVSGPGRGITIGSASKSFWGGLRIGWLRADETTIMHLALAKGSEDLGTSLLAQIVAARLLPHIDEARAERRAALSTARSELLTAIDEELPGWQASSPRAGGSAWVRMPEPAAVAFSEHLNRQGILLLPGPTFRVHDEFTDFVRIPFVLGAAQARESVVEIAREWRAFRH